MTSPATDHAATIADDVLELLASVGVTYVFTCPGTTEVPLLVAAERREGPQLVLTTHESAAVAMADAYARATGEVGVVLLHANVGLCNGLAPMYAAQVAGTPLLVLNGIKSTPLHERRAMTFTPDSQRLAEPFCKSSMVSGVAADVVDDLARAIGVAQQPPTGPVYLGLPQDLLHRESTGGAIPRPSQPETRAAEKKSLRKALDLMAAAERPLLIAGPEVARRNLADIVEDIAASLCIPIADPPWRDAEWATVRSAHSHYCGVYRRDDPVMQSSDLVVVVGAPPLLESEPRPGTGLPGSATVIRIVDDPSWIDPRDERRVGVVGDVRETLLHVQRALPELHLDNSSREFHRKELRSRWEARRSTVDPTVESNTTISGVPIHTALRTVAEHIDENTTAVLDPVTATSELLDLLPRRTSSLFATGSGALGWGMGAAVGVALAQPDRQVVGIVGDGVFQFGVQAIATAVRLNLPVMWIVLNNGGYHAVRNAVAKGKGGGPARSHPLADVTGVDYAAIAEGFGARGVTVETPDALRKALTQPAPTHVPTVIDMRLHGQTTNPPGS